jgi:hypothetical protein
MPDLQKLKPKSKFKKFLSALGKIFNACGRGRKKTEVKNMDPEPRPPGIAI